MIGIDFVAVIEEIMTNKGEKFQVFQFEDETISVLPLSWVINEKVSIIFYR